MMSKKSVCIVGNGAWGNALLHTVSKNTDSVRLAGRGETVTEEIIVVAVPANNIRELASVIRPEHARPVIINTAKGIEEKTHQLPHEIIRELFPDCAYYTLVGPGFAGEVMQDMPTLVNLGYGQKTEEVSKIAALFQTATFRVRPAAATHILELAAALKNIYAIGCGLADGLGFAVNTRTLLTVVAIEEMWQLFSALKLSIGTRSTAGTIGDLMLTCNSRESRNFSFGRAIATATVATALQQAKGVVEGYTSLHSVSYWEDLAGRELPLARFIRESVERDEPQTIQQRFAAFIQHV